MTTFNLEAYNVQAMTCCELTEISGGGVLRDLGEAIGYCVGYLGGAIKDAVTSHGGDVAGSGNAATVAAYK